MDGEPITGSGALPPAGTRIRAPGQGVHEAESLLDLGGPKRGTQFAHLLLAKCSLRKSAKNGNWLVVAASLTRPNFGEAPVSVLQ